VKAISSEMILMVGVLVAVGILLLQLRGLFSTQVMLGQEEVVSGFANELESIIDKAMAVTGDASFVYYPTVKSYKLEVEPNTISIYDKISKKTVIFAKSGVNFIPTVIEDSEVIYIKKTDDEVTLSGE